MPGYTVPVSTDRSDFIERFADYWAVEGASRIEGRIAAYLLLDDSDGVSAAELAEALDISRGSVSTITRRLESLGFITRVRVPGQRTLLHRMHADVWGGFLTRHQNYLRTQRDLAEHMLGRVPEGSPAHARLENMRDYMGWLVDVARLPEGWEQFKRERTP